VTNSKYDSNGAWQLRLGNEEIELRKRWLQLEPDDESVLRNDIDPLMSGQIDQLIESMYSHFLSFEDTKSFFPDEQTLKRAQSAQKRYFERLTKGDYDAQYVHDRLRVGSTHQRIELDPKWYIGAYNRVCFWMFPKLVEAFHSNSNKLSKGLLALLKVVFFDMGLAIDSYINAKEEAIRKHRDAIRELETEKRVTKSILEGAPIGIVSVDVNFVCLECNEEFVGIVGRDRSDIIGQSLDQVAPRLRKAIFDEVLHKGVPHRWTADLMALSRAVTDETYWDWAAWPVKDDTGHVIGLVAMFSNATDRVLLQQQREDFVATLTHDLKTPVSATNRAVRFILDGDFGDISESQKEILETILQSNTALYSLVQTLLDVYKFDSGVKEFHIRSCNLAATITQMVTEIMPIAHSVGVELRAELPSNVEEIRCDEEELRRVVQNLLDNSLKYTPSGGSILVSMEQENGTTTIRVTDTGRGVPEENMPKLFQRFWQAGSTGRYYASTGLGLYLCRRIVEGHGGRIWCTSTPGTGSTFTFELPNAVKSE
jgi:PAS domain S-box